MKREETTMPTEARSVEDTRSSTSTAPLPPAGPSRPISMLTSWATGIVLGLLAPVAIVAPRRFAAQAVQHPLLTPLTVAGMLTAAWLYAMNRTVGIEHGILILGACGLAGLWAVTTVLGIGLVSRWSESDKAASYRSGSLVFSFGGGFCLVLLVLYYLVVPAIVAVVEPWLHDVGARTAFDITIAYIRLTGLILSVIAPIQFFRGMAAVGGGTVPPLEPLCRDCGYSLQGVEDTYRVNAVELGATDVVGTVCSECGCPLTASLEASARGGTAWTHGEDLSLRSWLRTLRQVIHRPREFFETLPLDTSREAAVRFWTWNLLASLACAGILFATNLGICIVTGVAFPVPIMAQEPAAALMSVPTPLWLPATIVGAAAVMWAIVMAGTVVLCGTAEYVWKRVSLLRGRNMHPAGLLLACYLSAQIYPILVAATAAFLGVRLGVLAIPTDHAPVTYDVLLLVRRNAAYIGVSAGLVVTGLGWLGWYWPAAMRAGLAMRYANS